MTTFVLCDFYCFLSDSKENRLHWKQKPVEKDKESQNKTKTKTHDPMRFLYYLVNGQSARKRSTYFQNKINLRLQLAPKCI